MIGYGELDMVCASAPAKVYFFGEHSVVYGKPAIAAAISLRTNVTVHSAPPSSHIYVNAPKRTSLERTPYVREVVMMLSKQYDIPTSGYWIDVQSEIPKAAGIGSSAALTVATIGAISSYFDIKLEPVEIASMGHAVERAVQGSASPTDTWISTFGGVYRIPERRRLSISEFIFVIGDTQETSSTKKLVGAVKTLKDNYPSIIGPLMDAMGALSDYGETLLVNGKLEEVGKLMNLNNSLLESLGVGTDALHKFVSVAISAGALGAKITGAGGGGCMVALSPSKDVAKNIANALEKCGGEVYVVKSTDIGLRLEV
ncbi:MAG: mevalonate kinase [Methermicoccaceae archaeon]